MITARCLHIIRGACIHHSSLDLSRPDLVVIWDSFSESNGSDLGRWMHCSVRGLFGVMVVSER